jgi:hypothetical protein
MESLGDFDGASSEATWKVVAGSGTADLEGLRGSGGFEASRGNEATYVFEYELG